jgi:hypothetical protein
MAGRVRKTFFSALQSRHSQQTEMRSVVSFHALTASARLDLQREGSRRRNRDALTNR